MSIDCHDFDVKATLNDRGLLEQVFKLAVEKAILCARSDPTVDIQAVEIVEVTDRPGNYEDVAFVRIHFKER